MVRWRTRGSMSSLRSLSLCHRAVRSAADAEAVCGGGGRRMPKAKRKRTVGKNMRVVLALDEYLPDNLSVSNVEKIRCVPASKEPTHQR